MWRRVGLLLFGSLFCLAACSSDDEDDDTDEGAYPGVVEWRCFEGADSCWCAGLGPGDEADSSDPRVDACSYTNCYSYEWYGWHCECWPDAYPPNDEWTSVQSLPACPPGST